MITLSRQRSFLITLDAGAGPEAFARDLEAGLSARPRRLSCAYFYDEEGSRLFEEICALPEYYLPQAEREVLRDHAAEIVFGLPEDVTLVELGSGNAAKTRILIEALLQRQERLCYIPVDICRTVLEESSQALTADYPGLEVVALAGEYHDGLRHLQAVGTSPKLILWLGSNIGNFDRPDAARFLRAVRDTMAVGDRLLAGIDLRKDRGVLERAYDDSRGVTARFNLNLLARINRELGGRFDLGRFRHRAVYNEEAGRVEMYLVSTADQRVAIDRLGREFEFAAGEAIHTENSYKYSPAEIDALAEAAGLRTERRWFDGEGRFSTNLLVKT